MFLGLKTPRWLRVTGPGRVDGCAGRAGDDGEEGECGSEDGMGPGDSVGCCWAGPREGEVGGLGSPVGELDCRGVRGPAVRRGRGGPVENGGPVEEDGPGEDGPGEEGAVWAR